MSFINEQLTYDILDLKMKIKDLEKAQKEEVNEDNELQFLKTEMFKLFSLFEIILSFVEDFDVFKYLRIDKAMYQELLFYISMFRTEEEHIYNFVVNDNNMFNINDKEFYKGINKKEFFENE